MIHALIHSAEGADHPLRWMRHTVGRQSTPHTQEDHLVTLNRTDIVTALADAGLTLVSLTEHPEPFWQPGDIDAAAWRGRLPNTYTLLARRR